MNSQVLKTLVKIQFPHVDSAVMFSTQSVLLTFSVLGMQAALKLYNMCSFHSAPSLPLWQLYIWILTAYSTVSVL